MHFIDTNIFLRFLTKDDPQKAEACRSLLNQASEGKIKLYTNDIVFAELIWVLQSPKIYNLSPSEISELIISLAMIRGLNFPTKKYIPAMMELFVSADIDFIDIYNTVMMDTRDIDTIYSYDSDFDCLEGITRVEPAL